MKGRKGDDAGEEGPGVGSAGASWGPRNSGPHQSGEGEVRKSGAGSLKHRARLAAAQMGRLAWQTHPSSAK